MEAACIIVYGQSSGPGDSMSAVPAVKYNVAVTPELQKNRSDEVKKYKEVKFYGQNQIKAYRYPQSRLFPGGGYGSALQP